MLQTSSSGQKTYQAAYEAFGTRTWEYGNTPERQRANTKEESFTFKLLNEGHRYRDLETGVWLTRDPAGFVDGPNLYAYVRQNPWSKFDPEGLMTWGQYWGEVGEVFKGYWDATGGAVIATAHAIKELPSNIQSIASDVSELSQTHSAAQIIGGVTAEVAGNVKAGVAEYMEKVERGDNRAIGQGIMTVLTVSGGTAAKFAKAKPKPASPGTYVKSDAPAVQRTLTKDKNGVMQPDVDVPHT